MLHPPAGFTILYLTGFVMIGLLSSLHKRFPGSAFQVVLYLHSVKQEQAFLN